MISQYWRPDFNGDVRRLENVIYALRELGIKVNLITTIPHYPNGERKGYKARLIQIEQAEFGKIIRLYMPRIKHEGFSRRLILYTWFSFIAIIPTLIYGKEKIWIFSQRVFTTFSAFPAKLLRRTKIISDVTDVWPEALVNTGYAEEGSMIFKIGRIIAMIAYRCSDMITTLSNSMKDYFLNIYKVDPRRIKIIPNAAKKFYEKAEKENVLLFYGNLGKNYDFEALLSMAEKLKDHEIIIKGEGEQLAEILEKIEKKKLKNVILIKEYLKEKELGELISKSKALILPLKNQRFEGASMPIKLVEYIMNEKPIIFIGNDRYIFELIEKNKIGIAVSKNEIEKIYDFLIKLKDENFYNEIEENLRRIGKEFSLENFIINIENLVYKS